MKVLGRIIVILLGLLAVAVVAAAIFAVVLIRQPFPVTDGSVTVDGVQAEVKIYRDDLGIPHIYAQNGADLYFAQGYVHAQDRFWQMEFWRRTGQGRLSEIVGQDTLESDKFIRTMGWNRMAEATAAYYRDEAPEYYTLLEAYAQGVNAYLAEHRDEIAISQDILGLIGRTWEIEPWEPADTVGWGVVMSFRLASDYDTELSRARMIKALGEADVTNLLPTYPYDRRPVIAATEDQVNELPEEVNGPRPLAAEEIDWQRVNLDTLADAGPYLGLDPFTGSNNWVVSGEHTASGQPLLANDPHLGIQMPSIWYEVGLHAPDIDVVGFSFAGVPGVIIGHNDHIAWGVTNAGVDVQDIYIERVNPSNPDQVEFMGKWEDMEIVEEVIKVNGGEDVVLKVRQTRHGPIINDVFDDLDDVLAVRWVVEEPSRILQSVTMLNRAENYEQFREALRYWDVPAQNFVYADVEGNIAYQLPGRIPIRAGGQGLQPVPGWTGEYEWQGWIPYEELPALLNPDKGYIVTANHAIVDPDYPHFLDVYWANGDRAQRIENLLEEAIEAGSVDADDFARIQFDHYSLLAETYVPLLDGLSSDDDQVQAALERMRGWDYQASRDSVPAALHEIFYSKLARLVLADDVGAADEDFVWQSDAQSVFFYDLAGQPQARWWDDIRTPEKESQEDILLQAVAETVAWYEDQQGGNMNDWLWGEVHTATFVSDPIGQSGIGLLESLVNRGVYPVNGSSYTVNVAGWSWAEPAGIGGLASMRMIIDLDDLSASQSVHTTGQSGHPAHRHYGDMIPLWQNGEYHPMLWTPEQVEAAAEELLILQP